MKISNKQNIRKKKGIITSIKQKKIKMLQSPLPPRNEKKTKLTNS